MGRIGFQVKLVKAERGEEEEEEEKNAATEG